MINESYDQDGYYFIDASGIKCVTVEYIVEYFDISFHRVDVLEKHSFLVQSAHEEFAYSRSSFIRLKSIYDEIKKDFYRMWGRKKHFPFPTVTKLNEYAKRVL